MKIFSYLIIICLFFLNTYSQDKTAVYQGKKIISIPAAKSEPFIDGKLSDDIWNTTQGFILNHINNALTTPYDKTIVKVVSSKTNLYVSFYCDEPKPNELITKAINADDEMTADDTVSVLLCAGAEAAGKTYLLTVNGKGIVYDCLNKDKSWNWEGSTVAVSKGENFWTVEMALPLSVFEKDLKKVKIKGWRANFYRVRQERGWEDLTAASWMSIFGNYYYDGEQAGYMFLEALGEKPPEGTAVVVATSNEVEYQSLIAVQVPKYTKDEIAIDGDIRDQINGCATPITFKRLDLKPEANNKQIPLKNKTEGWLCTVKDSLVVSVRCHDISMNKLMSSEKVRDSGNAWADDSVEIFLKIGPEESTSYYHIAVNAHGSIYDSYEGKVEWNGNNIKAAAVRYDNYWDVEIQIPFEDLDKEKLKAAANLPWRFNLVRHRANHERGDELEEAAWSPTYSNKSHVPSKFGYIFMDEVNAKLPNK